MNTFPNSPGYLHVGAKVGASPRERKTGGPKQNFKSLAKLNRWFTRLFLTRSHLREVTPRLPTGRRDGIGHDPRQDVFTARPPERKYNTHSTKPPASPVGELTCHTPDMQCDQWQCQPQGQGEGKRKKVRWPSAKQQPRVGTQVPGRHFPMETARQNRANGSLLPILTLSFLEWQLVFFLTYYNLAIFYKNISLNKNLII
jgi:hypothetical protein